MEVSSTATLERLDSAGRALLFTEARTANSFAPIPVTDDELAAVWDLAKWPPGLRPGQMAADRRQHAAAAGALRAHRGRP